MSEIDCDGYFDNIDTLDDGMDHGDEYAFGFQSFDPDQPTDSDVEE